MFTRYCHICRYPIDENNVFCPKCGNKILPPHPHNWEYYHSVIPFVYDNYSPVYDKTGFLGISVSRNGKKGFIRHRHKNNSLGLMYLGCKYDAVVPIRNVSPYKYGRVNGPYAIVFEVRNDGKWTIALSGTYSNSPSQTYKDYDEVHIIRDYPSMAIVQSNGKYSFLDLNTGIEDNRKYEEIFEVYSKHDTYKAGIYYACIHSWQQKYAYSFGYVRYGKADIFSVEGKKNIGCEEFEWDYRYEFRSLSWFKKLL